MPLKKKKCSYLIPVERATGTVPRSFRVHHPAYANLYAEQYAMIENYQFQETFSVDLIARGKSATWINLTAASTGKVSHMFLSDFAKAIKQTNMNRGVISGTWTYTKRGKYYGIKLVF